MVSNSLSIRPSLSLTREPRNATLTGKQVLHEHFPEPVDATVPVPAKQDHSLEKNFHRAIQLFIQQTLNEKKPRDRQYTYLHPGGDYVFQKPMMQTPVEHL
jgi:hypothetical protein